LHFLREAFSIYYLRVKGRFSDILQDGFLWNLADAPEANDREAKSPVGGALMRRKKFF